MNASEFQYRLENLAMQDADYVVDVLEISSQELIDAFPDRAKKHIEEEWGIENEEDDFGEDCEI